MMIRSSQTCHCPKNTQVLFNLICSFAYGTRILKTQQAAFVMLDNKVLKDFKQIVISK